MGPPPPHGHPGMGPAQVISVHGHDKERSSSSNPADDNESPSSKEEDAKKVIDVDAGDETAVISAGPSVTKVKKEGEVETRTPATVNETMSEISPSAFASAERAAQAYSGGSGAPSYLYHTHQKPYHPGSPPNSSPSYFSRITGPPSAYHYAHPPPPPGSSGEESASGRRLSHMPPPPPPGSYMYQYQHFDPRSEVDAPMPPKRRMPGVSMTINNPYYHGGSMVNVPPTVHMPSNGPGPVVKDLISPLPNFSAIKTGKSAHHHGMITHEPSTPEKESEAASGLASMSAEKRARPPKASPLHLLSQVSTSPAVPPGRRHQSRYSYPPTHGHYSGYMKSEEEDPTATPAPKSKLSACDLILSAANTIEKDGKKRKSLGDVDDVKKKLHKKGPSANLFSVGGYPPGVDPSSLPRGRSRPERPPPKALQKKLIDPDTAEQADKASRLAQQALERPRVGKQLLLSMALIRSNPRTPPSCYPSHGTVLGDRFHWAAYPPLDMVLRKHMEQYYELSTSKCQSREQQEFNNELVIKIRDEARRYGWEFDDKKFDDKKIRDRVRCFYKTHIQNAKKRLKTMLRNPDKRANIKALAAHFHLIEDKTGDEDDNNGEGFDNDNTSNDDGGRQSSVPEHDSIGFGLSQSYSNESGYGDDDNTYSNRYSTGTSHRQSYESSGHDNEEMAV